MTAQNTIESVVVFGGTGRTGHRIVEDALAAGFHVRVAARNPTSTSAMGLPTEVEVVPIDFADRRTVAAALAGRQAVVHALSPAGRHPNGLYSTSMRAILDVAPSTEVRRLVVVSSGGVAPEDPNLAFWYRRIVIPLILREVYDDMTAMERLVEGSGLDWVLVRASYLRDGDALGGTRVIDGGVPKGGWRIRRADLARFVVDQLRSDEWVGRHPTIAR